MTYIVTNCEKINGQTHDNTKRAFESYEDAQERFFALIDTVFEETHPDVSPYNLDAFKKFVEDTIDGNTFHYEQDGHTYDIDIRVSWYD